MYYLLIIFVLKFQNGLAQMGSDCNTDEDCNSLQHCQYGYCICPFGYVKNIALQHCFEIKKYGEECFFDIQCNDHRMECSTPNGDGSRRCMCSGYSSWDGKECYDKMNITEILNSIRVENSILVKLEKQATKIFRFIFIVGAFIFGFLISFIMACFIYGCCFKYGKRRQDSEDNLLGALDAGMLHSPDGRAAGGRRNREQVI